MAANAVDSFVQQNREALDRLQKQLLESPDSWAPSEADAKLLEQLDATCKQRDCLLSRLFWHTDLVQAEAQATAEHKPILALHLLGRLDETFSCANSRYFRVLYYANPETADYLRQHYVLYWHSVRPAPKISIDFGDGRVLQTTITGNSLHFVLDASGAPLDALPGLQSPKLFLDWLKRSAALAQQPGKALGEYHQKRLEALRSQWAHEHQSAGLGAPKWDLPLAIAPPEALPSAIAAAAFAAGKMLVQMPMVRALAPKPVPIDTLRADPVWTALAATQSFALDAHSVALMKSQHPTTGGSNVPRLLAQFVESVAADSVWNEYAFHARIHQWFIEKRPASADALNDRIYSELFFTPAQDPWLGLKPVDAFTGIPNNGISSQR